MLITDNPTYAFHIYTQLDYLQLRLGLNIALVISDNTIFNQTRVKANVLTFVILDQTRQLKTFIYSILHFNTQCPLDFGIDLNIFALSLCRLLT